jgi:hypothetical protein
MLSSTVPEPDANGECCRAIFPLGIRFGSTIELGVMTAPGNTSTRYCAAMCGSKLGERVNHVLGLSTAKVLKQQKWVAKKDLTHTNRFWSQVPSHD